jgi:RimJ/RimL family protein N-acetyltransferase
MSSGQGRTTRGPQLRLLGTRTALRDFTLADVDRVAAIVGDDRVTRWLSFESRDRQATVRMLESATAAAQRIPRTEFYLAVTELDADEVVGFVRLARSGVQAAKLGYATHADCWGKGFATDSARALVDHGFGTLGLHRISAAVGPQNERSIAVLLRLGFALEGRLRDHVHTNGQWRDSLLYAKLAPPALP